MVNFKCSFCGRARHEVRHLISGPGVFICDECVALCVEILKEETEKGTSSDTRGADPPSTSRSCEIIRRRPEVYIGSTDATGLERMVWALVENSIDEALAGFGDRIDITLHRDGSVTVEDHGRGIPTLILASAGRPALEVVMTTLHASAGPDPTAHAPSRPCHAVQLVVVNALSESLLVEVRRDGKVYRQHYRRGEPSTEHLMVDVCEERSGTRITFKPDPEIFADAELSFANVALGLRAMPRHEADFTITLADERSGESQPIT